MERIDSAEIAKTIFWGNGLKLRKIWQHSMRYFVFRQSFYYFCSVF